ncbi:hypothetical protein DYB28_007971 [Aphanomyces astaci]|uniref:Uncharacterized protein n=1 Tax=Aphanomyces astaci TaxID=112090 RepID=A0A9X8HF55_APHAT|nr:hypothetical protein DYB28_007971 [Aphanomyces astaci]
MVAEPGTAGGVATSALDRAHALRRGSDGGDHLGIRWALVGMPCAESASAEAMRSALARSLLLQWSDPNIGDDLATVLALAAKLSEFHR